ncbi:IS1380 family transposase [Verrucomicrobium sp. 3C]|uniref:IS1380 family transposase n=1 Tax=Verrucomicrobium sp. 3C TaxID=1134055 RepID=UPI0003A2605B|nr:IS1380 family transposase [Verrucomicrobium sp. 3C]
MTECIQETFAFTDHFSRRVEAGFTAGRISSDGGAILLREADRKIGLLRRLEGCFRDRRHPKRIVHRVREMLAQRIFGIALGYEDLNDHEQLRTDPLVALLSGKSDLEEDLAGKSTLNRLELVGRSERYHKIDYSAEAIDRLLVDLYLESHPRPPEEVVLDLDATDIPLYGHQPERFFHGYYDSYCYLPLYIFADDQLLGVRLRPSNQDASAGSLTEVSRIVGQLRSRWPGVKIVLRADSGFCREEIMAWCEANQVDYLFGFARNERVCRTIEASMEQARRLRESSGKPARFFTEFAYGTLNTWSRERRVVAKAEYLERGENPRFVVTSLSSEEWPAQDLCEKLYCARGDMENRIKEQLYLFADRLSTAQMASNQLRLYFSALAYTLVEALRRLGLRGTDWAEAQVDTLRLKLFKIGTLVRVSVRRVLLSMSSAYPWKSLFTHAFRVLRC